MEKEVPKKTRQEKLEGTVMNKIQDPTCIRTYNFKFKKIGMTLCFRLLEDEYA